MYRIVVIGNGRAAKLVVAQIQSLTPDATFTVFGPELSPREGNWFRKQLVDLRQGILATEVDRFARRVTGSDGSRTVFHRLILTDFSPELARSAKLQVARGVLVNAYMQTSDGYVYALGDSVECAEGTRLGSLDDQARVIAQHLCAASPRMFVGAEMAPAI
jgi:NAD(P)H-nitrite reductase large subunit